MRSQCYSWITHLYNGLRRGGGGDDDDDDETSIVSKKRPLLQPRKVEQLRFERPLILRYFCPKYLRLYIIQGNNNSEKECKLQGIKSLKSANFVACCDGLVLLSSTTANDRTQYVVSNPLNNNIITTIESPDHHTHTSQACGFFFHPLAKDYRILAAGGRRDRLAGPYQYQIYSFEAKNWRKIASPNFKFRPWKSDKLSDGNAAIVNGALHWYIGENAVMVFDMISEELTVKFLPFGNYLRKKLYHFNGFLRTKGEELCFCAVVYREPAAIETWVLEDYAEWRWSKKYVVDLSNWDMAEYPLLEPSLTLFSVVSVVGFYRDEMVLFWRHRGLFVYNLEFRSVERIWMNKLGLPRARQASYDQYCGFAYLT